MLPDGHDARAGQQRLPQPGSVHRGAERVEESRAAVRGSAEGDDGGRHEPGSGRQVRSRPCRPSPPAPGTTTPTTGTTTPTTGTTTPTTGTTTPTTGTTTPTTGTTTPAAGSTTTTTTRRSRKRDTDDSSRPPLRTLRADRRGPVAGHPSHGSRARQRQRNGNGKPKAPKSDKPSYAIAVPRRPHPPRRRAVTLGLVRHDHHDHHVPAPTAADTVAASPDVFTAVSTFRQYGAWLDDASAATPGEGQTSVGHRALAHERHDPDELPDDRHGHRRHRSAAGQRAACPSTTRTYDGVTARGVDDIYLSAKYVLVDPTLTLSEVGVAISPVVEVLSAGAPDGRVHFARAGERRSPPAAVPRLWLGAATSLADRCSREERSSGRRRAGSRSRGR